MTAREKFKVGDRVRRTAEHTTKYTRHHEATVVGFSYLPNCVRVRYDGAKISAPACHMDHWEVIPATEGQ